MLSENDRIFIAGHRGMVGSAVLRKLGHSTLEVLTAEKQDLDLTNEIAVNEFFENKRPTVVIVAAARVGGILANSEQPVDFLLNNLKIQNSVIPAAHRSGVRKLCFLGSSCIYPKLSKQPIKEEYLLSGALEETNQWYALAKISGIKLCEAYRQQFGNDFFSVLPCNLYGPGDNYNLKSSHVIPALIRKFHEAKINREQTVEVWGSGKPLREFLHVDDCASGLIHLLHMDQSRSIYNLGSGEDISIERLTRLIANIVGFLGRIVFNTNFPDGTPRKLLDISEVEKLGWKPTINLEKGLAEVYEEFRSDYRNQRL